MCNKVSIIKTSVILYEMWRLWVPWPCCRSWRFGWWCLRRCRLIWIRLEWDRSNTNSFPASTAYITVANRDRNREEMGYRRERARKRKFTRFNRHIHVDFLSNGLTAQVIIGRQKILLWIPVIDNEDYHLCGWMWIPFSSFYTSTVRPDKRVIYVWNIILRAGLRWDKADIKTGQ